MLRRYADVKPNEEKVTEYLGMIYQGWDHHFGDE
jgi:hypothetical protein